MYDVVNSRFIKLHKIDFICTICTYKKYINKYIIDMHINIGIRKI